jgi:hypothetical protein
MAADIEDPEAGGGPPTAAVPLESGGARERWSRKAGIIQIFSTQSSYG